MRLRLKLTASILALTLPLAALTAYGMEDKQKEMAASPIRSSGSPALPRNLKKATFEEKTVKPSEFLKVKIIKDTFDDSGSAAYHPESDIKKDMQARLAESTGQKEVRRILQLDGGGVRGLFPIIELCVLEEIINHPSNDEKRRELLAKMGKNPDDRLYIRDLFDVGTGTSTGSILTAGLFSKADLSAIDVAQLYVRFGHIIFDDQKRVTIPGLNMGLLGATYSNEGLYRLLTHHFGNSLMTDVHKPIYIVALNETKQEAAIFSSKEQVGDQDQLHKTPLIQAVLASASAPTFLPGVTSVVGNGRVLLSDGGTVMNNSAHVVFGLEKARYTNPYEIYSFGTGSVPPPLVRSEDSGVAQVATILKNTLEAGEKLAQQRCVDEICSPTSQLGYYARINPKLEVGMDKLDDTSSTYVNYAIKKAFSLTQGAVFANMIIQLGFKSPDAEIFGKIYADILNKLDTLKSKEYDKLDDFEKLFVMRRVLELDFKFYKKRLYRDVKTGESVQMTEEEATAFLKSLMKDVVTNKKKGDGITSKLWSYITASNEDNILEFIPRCQEFHKLSFGQDTLQAADLQRLLDKPKTHFTHEQLKTLSPEHTIRGEGLKMYKSVASDASTPATDLVLILFTKFIAHCKGETAPADHKVQFTYENNQSRFAHLPTLIFWRNVLYELEDQMTREKLVLLKTNLQEYASQVIVSRSYTGEILAGLVRDSRYQALIDGLAKYTEKYHKE